MSNKQSGRARKLKIRMPNSDKIERIEEIRESRQKQSFKKYWDLKDEFITFENNNEKITISTHIPCKIFFINRADQLEYLKVRIDVIINLIYSEMWHGELIYQRVTYFYKNHVLSQEEFEDQTEMEEIELRTFPLKTTIFYWLPIILNNVFRQTFFRVFGIEETNRPLNFVQEWWDKDITPKDYIYNEEKDNAETLERKNILLGNLKGFFENVFRVMVNQENNSIIDKDSKKKGKSKVIMPSYLKKEQQKNSKESEPETSIPAKKDKKEVAPIEEKNKELSDEAKGWLTGKD